MTTFCVINCFSFAINGTRASVDSPRRDVANYGLRGTAAGSQRLDVKGLRPRSARGGDIGAREGVLGEPFDREREAVPW